tara:strand:- start:1306 stop:1446 length:141 start_codon:yes stop_codon:yes gene_type:complete
MAKVKNEKLVQAINRLEKVEYGTKELIHGLIIGIIVGFIIAMVLLK